MRIALAQINPVVGDLDGNRERILARLGEARDAGADLALFPELAVTGYPPEDLLLRAGVLRAGGGRPPPAPPPPSPPSSPCPAPRRRPCCCGPGSCARRARAWTRSRPRP